MKTKIIFLLVALVISGATIAGKPVLIGTLNMISTRNIEAQSNYILLKRSTNDSKQAFKANKAKTIDGAIQIAVMNVPGGEFLKNVKLYTDGKQYAVVGDVWGIAGHTQIEGFAVGDIAYIKNKGLENTFDKEKFIPVTVSVLKDRNTCIVKFENGKVKEVKYSELSKK